MRSYLKPSYPVNYKPKDIYNSNMEYILGQLCDEVLATLLYKYKLAIKYKNQTFRGMYSSDDSKS